MYTVVDVASYILDEYGPLTTMRLQKLAFYSQAQFLVNHGSPIFGEDFEAWVNGPVAPQLYRLHKGKFLLHRGDLASAVEGDVPLPQCVKDEVDAVCSSLVGLTGKELSERTHREDPWMDARRGCGPSEPCRKVIHKDVMADYYRRHPVGA